MKKKSKATTVNIPVHTFTRKPHWRSVEESSVAAARTHPHHSNNKIIIWDTQKDTQVVPPVYPAKVIHFYDSGHPNANSWGQVTIPDPDYNTKLADYNYQLAEIDSRKASGRYKEAHEFEHISNYEFFQKFRLGGIANTSHSNWVFDEDAHMLNIFHTELDIALAKLTWTRGVSESAKWTFRKHGDKFTAMLVLDDAGEPDMTPVAVGGP